MRAAVVVLVVVLASVFASPARAHSDIVSSSPASGSTVTAAPEEIALTFGGVIRGQFSTVVVTGPGGVRYASGEPKAVDRTLYQPVEPLVSGSYTVAWRVVSGDGHPLQGVFRFTADLPATQPSSAAAGASPSGAGSPSPAAERSRAPEPSEAAVASASDGGGSPAFLLAAGAAVVIVVAGVVVLARRRRVS
ncbi:copper resistance protein CopC [Cryptosporangium sp. NPDC051539]|uniref:copper resistance protein CopC n=1 Tax=Cryptosporangium sp. NPDC051539 TaxID=3363962 RepID=UPI0037A19E11